MSLDLSSVNAKIARAEEHLRILDDEIAKWHGSKPYELIPEINADFTRRAVRLRVHRAPDFGRWALILGDCLHNARAALDHLLHAIATHEGNGVVAPDVERDLMFILLDDASKFGASAKRRKVTTLSQSVQAAIESVQPYKRPFGGKTPLLTMLRDLDNADKHHLVRPTYAAQSEAKFLIRRNLPANANPRTSFRSEPLEDGAEIGSVTTDVPTPQMEYEFHAPIAVCITHGGKLSSIPGIARVIIQDVRDVVGIVSAAVV